jgi:hypothetical protein
MPELDCAGKEHCTVCGSCEYNAAHFALGRLFCVHCWREIERSRRKSNPAQPSLSGIEPAPIHHCENLKPKT